MQPHEYERGGTAKLLTLFRPATGLLRAKGVLSAPNAVLHPWLKEQLSAMLAEIEKEHPREELPPEAERPLCAQWETWLGHPPRGKPLPPLCIVVVLDNLAGHLSYDLVLWFFSSQPETACMWKLCPVQEIGMSGVYAPNIAKSNCLNSSVVD